jgi:hypothetical protein
MAVKMTFIEKSVRLDENTKPVMRITVEIPLHYDLGIKSGDDKREFYDEFINMMLTQYVNKGNK